MFKSLLGKYILLWVAVMVWVAGCAPPPKPAPFVWPAPPSEPKFMFKQVLRTEEDLEKTDWQRFAAEFLGEASEFSLAQPSDVHGDGAGRIYIALPLGRRVVAVDFNQRRMWDFGPSVSPFERPAGVVVDSRGTVYVVDQDAHKVMVFDASGRPLSAFGDAELLQRPTKAVINEALGRIYVTDSKGCKVQVFSLQGAHLFTIGGEFRGNGAGDFNSPQGLALDAQGRIFVADSLNARIQVFDPDGKFLYKFGVRGTGWSYFEDPKDLAFDTEGNLHIVDFRKSALLSYSPDGTFLLVTTMGPATDLVGFHGPNAIWIGSDDQLYISDYFNGRISIWQYLSAEYLEQNPLPGKTRAAVKKPAAK